MVTFLRRLKEFMDRLISERKLEQKDQNPFKFWFTFCVYEVIY